MAATYAVTISGAAAGQVISNHFGFRDTTAPGTRSPQDVCQAISAEWVENVLPFLSSFYTLNNVSCYDILNPEVGGVAGGDAGAVGGSGGLALPTFVCAKVQFNTAKRGRAFRGRTGLGPLPEVYTDSTNALSSGARQSAQVAIDQFNDELAAVDLEQVVISRYKGKNDDGTPKLRDVPIYTPVTGYFVHNLLGSRVSRKA